MQGNGELAIDPQVCKQALGGDQRTETFDKTGPTMGDTASSVNGVLDNELCI